MAGRGKGRGGGGFARKANVHNLRLAADTGADLTAISSLHQSLSDRPIPLYPEYEEGKMPERYAATDDEQYLMEKTLELQQRLKASRQHLKLKPPGREIERYSDAYKEAESSLSDILASNIFAGLYPAELTKEMAKETKARRHGTTAMAGQFASAGFVAGGARRMRSLSGAFGQLEEKEREGHMAAPANGVLVAPAAAQSAMPRRMSMSSMGTDEGDDDLDYGRNFYNSDEEDGGGDEDEPTM